MVAVSCAMHWCAQVVLIGVSMYVLCVIEAVKMDACSRPSVSKCVTARVERDSILWSEYCRLGWRSNHSCFYKQGGKF